MLATDALAAERAHTAAAVAALNAMRRRCDDAESQLLVAREAAANSSPTTNRAARPVDSLDEDGGSRDADLDADESDMDADADESGAGGVMRLSHRIGNSARPTQLAVSAAAAAALPSEQRFVAATAASGADASASDASAATESTSASASAGELTALRGQVQSLLEQLSVARAQIRDGADANARVSQQWARDRDRADALWDKLQAATAEARAATAAAAEAKSTRERQQSDNSSDLVVEQQQLQLQLVQATQRAAHFEALHAALADEVRAAELRLRRLPGDLMFTEDGDEDTALLPLTASAGAIDGQGPEDGGGHGASSENAYRYHSTGDVAEHLLAPTEFSRPPSSVDDVATLTLSPFDFATTARLSTTAAASSALPSDSLYDPSAYSSMPLFVSSSSSEFASSSPTPLSSSSSQSALAALIGAAHANIQRRATRAAAAVHKARDEAIAAHTEGAAAVGLTDTYLEQLVRVQRELSASRRVGDRGGDDGGMARGSGGDDESW